MRHGVLAALGFFTVVALGAPPLKILTYDSFATPSGLGPVLVAEAKKQGLAIRFQTFESESGLAMQVVQAKSCPGDLVIGIDEVQFGRVAASRKFLPQKERLVDVPEGRWFDPERRFVPYDYGYLAVVYDSARVKNPIAGEVSLASLATDPRYKKRIAFLDPRTAGVGLAFLLWTRAVLGEEKLEGFWKGAAAQAATIAPSWSTAYALFDKGEVDYVVSYTSSPAYHLLEEKKTTVRSISIAEGHWPQTETAAVFACTSRPADAAKVLALLVGLEVQKALPTKQWMYPARKDVSVPEAFGAKPKAVATGSIDAMPKAIESSLRRWREAIAR